MQIHTGLLHAQSRFHCWQAKTLTLIHTQHTHAFWNHIILCILQKSPCYCADDCFDGEVQFSEGQTEWEGRLEVCLGQRWGTVGSDGWTETNSLVVCNALGYDFSGSLIQPTMNILYSFLKVKPPCLTQISWLTTLYPRLYQSQSTYTRLSAPVET